MYSKIHKRLKSLDLQALFDWHARCDSPCVTRTLGGNLMSTNAVTYESLLATMAEDATQLQIAALKCESMIPLITGKMQQARIQLTAAVFREKAERLDQLVSFVRNEENYKAPRHVQ
jgi:hypothetical protein